MVRLAVILKEVLAGTNEVPAFNLQVKLFEKLAEECLASRFPRVDTTARQRPEVVAGEPMQQYVAVVQNEGSSTVVESMRTNTDGDHAA